MKKTHLIHFRTVDAPGFTINLEKEIRRAKKAQYMACKLIESDVPNDLISYVLSFANLKDTIKGLEILWEHAFEGEM